MARERSDAAIAALRRLPGDTGFLAALAESLRRPEPFVQLEEAAGLEARAPDQAAVDVLLARSSGALAGFIEPP
jgi:hypothetical protein